MLTLPISTKLDRDNYLSWQSQIVPLLHAYGLYRFLEITTPPSATILTDTWLDSDQPSLLTVVQAGPNASRLAPCFSYTRDSSPLRLNQEPQPICGTTSGDLSPPPLARGSLNSGESSKAPTRAESRALSMFRRCNPSPMSSLLLENRSPMMTSRCISFKVSAPSLIPW